MNGLANFFFLARPIATEPGFIVGPIARLFGIVVSFIFDIVYAINLIHPLGFTIILVTILFRACLLPTSIKAQKSMRMMQELKPELDKIEAKYGKNKDDPEIKKKMNAEKQALMTKHGANPLKGCFPMLLQMPLFIGLNFIIQQAFIYINRLGDVYYRLSEALLEVPGILYLLIPNTGGHTVAFPANHANATRLIPSAMHDNAQVAESLVRGGMSVPDAIAQAGDVINYESATSVSRIVNRFTPENWKWLQGMITNCTETVAEVSAWAHAWVYEPWFQSRTTADYSALWENIASINEQRNAMESFFGLSMIESSGWSWPSILIPLLVTITMFCAMWIGNQRNAGANTDEKAAMQQRIMIIVMPLFLGFITVGFPAGLGLFWITGQVFQGTTDFILLKKSGRSLRLPFMKKEE